MDPWLGEIRPFAFNFAPRGWAPCDGRLLPVNQNQALFSLIGTFFGGDGRIEFGLPDLRGRAIVGATALTTPLDVAYAIGEKAGTETVSLTADQMPAHTHSVRVSRKGDNQGLAANSYFALVSQSKTFPTVPIYGPASTDLVALRPDTVEPVGQQPHYNMQPFSVVSYCIALQGLYPGRE